MDKTYFIITIDTEMDNAWARPNKITLENLKLIPRFQNLCNEYGIIPTYLLTYECTNNDFAKDIFKPIVDSKKAELGHHLHAWTTPPFESDNGNGLDIAWNGAYQFQLPDGLFYEKANRLKEAIYTSYGVMPTSHRAGRWGIDKRTLAWLADNGFVVDSSVVPFFNNLDNYKSNLPDFIYEQTEASIINRKGSLRIVEVPMSLDLPFSTNNFIKNLLTKQVPSKRIGYSFLNKLGYCRMLRPWPEKSIAYHIRFIKNILHSNTNVINMMLHSSELAHKGSPYTQTLRHHHNFWSILESVFKYAKNKDIIPISLSNYATKILMK